MKIQVRYIKNPIKKYTFLLLASAILGVNILPIDLGFFQLSIYRILILLSPFLFFFVSKETKNKLRTGNNYLYFQFLLFWLFYSIITLFWVRDLSAWIRSFYFLLCGSITSWFIGWYFSSKKDIINALKVIEICALVFGLLGVYEIITGNYMFTSDEKAIFYETSDLTSTIGIRIPISVFFNPNNFAFFLLFAVYGSIALSRVKSTITGRLSSLVLVLFFLFLLFATQSRSGFIAFFLGVISLIFLYLKQCSIKKFSIFIIIGLILFAVITPWLIANKGLYLELLTFDASSGSDQERINLIRNGLIFLVNSFFLGVGLGNIEYYMATYAFYLTDQIIDIHNWWMEILVSSGVLVFSIYLIVYIKSILRLYRMSLLKKDKDIKHISTCFFCFLVASLIGTLGSSSLMPYEWFWPIIAIVMTFVNLGTKSVLTN